MFTWTFISDHWAVTLTLGLGAKRLSIWAIQVWKIIEITQEEFTNDFNDNSIDTGLTHLDTLVLQLNGELRRVYENLAPPKQVTLLEHDKQPWFDSDVKSQERKEKNQDKIWLRFHSESCWHAYIHERNRYNRILQYRRWNALTKKIKRMWHQH